MRFTFVALARHTGIAMTELLTWEPRDLATLVDLLDEEMAANKRQNRG